MRFAAEKGLAACGLACVLCSDAECPGCKARGCTEGSDCSVYQCVARKGLDGCYECADFPCEEGMHKGVRNRAFTLYAKQNGKQALLDRLQANAAQGITYHRPDGLQGDYDQLSTEAEVMQLIREGRDTP